MRKIVFMSIDAENTGVPRYPGLLGNNFDKAQITRHPQLPDVCIAELDDGTDSTEVYVELPDAPFDRLAIAEYCRVVNLWHCTAHVPELEAGVNQDDQFTAVCMLLLDVGSALLDGVRTFVLTVLEEEGAYAVFSDTNQPMGMVMLEVNDRPVLSEFEEHHVSLEKVIDVQ